MHDGRGERIITPRRSCLNAQITWEAERLSDGAGEFARGDARRMTVSVEENEDEKKAGLEPAKNHTLRG
jgi:hypothetical protein